MKLMPGAKVHCLRSHTRLLTASPKTEADLYVTIESGLPSGAESPAGQCPCLCAGRSFKVQLVPFRLLKEVTRRRKVGIEV